MVFSSYKKLRIVFFHRKGLKAPAIRKRLLEEGMVASRQGIHDFDVLVNDENVLANGDNVLENGVCEQLSKNLLIRCKLEASAYTTVRIAYSLLKRPCDCNGITKNVKFILTTTVQYTICSTVFYIFTCTVLRCPIPLFTVFPAGPLPGGRGDNS